MPVNPGSSPLCGVCFGSGYPSTPGDACSRCRGYGRDTTAPRSVVPPRADGLSVSLHGVARAWAARIARCEAADAGRPARGAVSCSVAPCASAMQAADAADADRSVPWPEVLSLRCASAVALISPPAGGESSACRRSRLSALRSELLAVAAISVHWCEAIERRLADQARAAETRKPTIVPEPASAALQPALTQHCKTQTTLSGVGT